MTKDDLFLTYGEVSELLLGLSNSDAIAGVIANAQLKKVVEYMANANADVGKNYLVLEPVDWQEIKKIAGVK